MSPTIRVCSAWETSHDRPVYTMDAACPRCGGATRAAGPAPFNPRDPHGRYRRALKRRNRE